MIRLKVILPTESNPVRHSENCPTIGSALFAGRKNIGSPQNEVAGAANGAPGTLEKEGGKVCSDHCRSLTP